MMHEMLQSEDPAVIRLLEEVRHVFVPISNPDCYAFSHQAPANRLWRKNRNPNEGSSCAYSAQS